MPQQVPGFAGQMHRTGACPLSMEVGGKIQKIRKVAVCLNFSVQSWPSVFPACFLLMPPFPFLYLPWRSTFVRARANSSGPSGRLSSRISTCRLFVLSLASKRSSPDVGTKSQPALAVRLPVSNQTSTRPKEPPERTTVTLT